MPLLSRALGALHACRGRRAPGKPAILFALLVLIIGAGPAGTAPALTSKRRILVSAASELTKAFAEMGAQFQKRTGIHVDFNFGATRKLAMQIENGAPVDLFAAADVESVAQLEKKRLVVPGSKRVYAFASLVIWMPPNAPLRVQDLAGLADARIKRIAIARPEKGCAGSAACEAMRKAGVWAKVSKKLICAEDVRQALQYAEGGTVDAAITSRALVGPCRGRVCKGTWAPIPDNLHQPIRQVLAIIRGTKHEREAQAFAAYMATLEGNSILARHGFIPNCPPVKVEP